MTKQLFQLIARPNSDSDGYSFKTNANGSIDRYYKGNFLSTEWRQGGVPDGVLDREDGPAIEHADGSYAYYRNGKLDRRGGPAISHADGDEYYYRNGVFIRMTRQGRQARRSQVP